MKRVLFILFAVVLLIGVENAFACSCLAPDPSKSLKEQVKEAYQGSSAVFTAKVISVTENKSEYRNVIKLRLTRAWKGKLTKTITLTTGINSAMCGYNFVIGKNYLVYAFSNESNKISTGLCSRTSLSAKNADIAVLNQIKRKT